MTFVVKILCADEFEQFRSNGSFAGSADDLRDGFIHLSHPRQVAGSLAKHFVMPDGSPEEGLTLVVFDPQNLGTELRLEESRGGALFPHLYGALSWPDVRLTLPVAVDGTAHIVPDINGQPELTD